MREWTRWKIDVRGEEGYMCLFRTDTFGSVTSNVLGHTSLTRPQVSTARANGSGVRLDT